MSGTIKSLISLMVIAASLYACGGTSRGALTLTEEDTGRTVNLKMGDGFLVQPEFSGPGLENPGHTIQFR